MLVISSVLFKSEGKRVRESLFKEYDIRGKVDSEFILEETYALGQAIAYYYLSKVGASVKVVVGRDGRTHSPYIAEHLIRALRDSGIHVVDIGLCPTPVVYFALHILPVDGALMVTASHNGKDYNGIKLCLGKEALWGAHIQKIKELYLERKGYTALMQGSYKELSLTEKYTTWLSWQFKELKNCKIPFIVDCAQGVAGPVMQRLCELLSWDTVELMHATIDGTFSCHEPDPVVAKNMEQLQERVRSAAVQFGIGFDGDGDRMAVMLPSGLVAGDTLISLFAQDILKKNPGRAVIYDIKCSKVVSEVVTRQGGYPYAAPSGHSIIKHHMKKHNALFAGEYSCHFFFKDRYFGYDDGLYAALRLCELIYRSGKRLEDIIATFPSYISSPEIRIACATEIRDKLLESTYSFFAAKKEAELSTVDGVQAILPYGWGLVRSSHTQPEVCLRFESTTAEGLKMIKKEFYTILKDHISEELLESSFEV
jgi:phosphomannomutase / phosphoglucomutase